MMRNYFFLLFALLCSPVLLAVQNELSFDAYTQMEGLPNNQIQCIYQDQQGWMWFGTSQGLSRFDGYEFDNFQPSLSDSASIRGSLVRVIVEDRQGRLLIGTENGGLNVFDRETEFFHHPFDRHPQLAGKEISVNDMEEDQEGRLWLATDNGIWIVDTLENIVSLSELSAGNDLCSGRYVRVIQFDNTGRLWVGTNNGLIRVDATSFESEIFELTPNAVNPNEIWELFLDTDGSMWIGTYLYGMFAVDPISLTVKHIELEPAYERSETVRTISRDRDEQYWIGTRGGLYVYEKAKGAKAFYRHDDRKPGSLINNSILDVYHDKRGETWIGTRGGVNLLARSKQVFRNFSAQPSDKNYLNSSIVYAFWVDEQENIWIGTEDGGVNIYHPQTGTFTYLMADEKRANTISRNCIKAFEKDRYNRLWIGSFWGGVDVLDLNTGRIHNFSHDPDHPASLADDKVMDLQLDHEGYIWAASWGGVDRINPETMTLEHFGHVVNDQVNWLMMDSKHNMWMGTPSQVLIYNPYSKKITRYNEHTRSASEDSQGRYWVATLDRGLALYNIEDGVQKYFTTSQGLVNNQALCVLEDEQMNLWISTTNGLSKFDPQTGVFQNYTSKDGLRNNQFSYGAAHKLPNGELMFGGIAGFNIFDPLEVKINKEPVPLVFTDLKIFNRKVLINDGEEPILTKSISQTSQLVLPYDQKVFTLEFAALNYVNSQSNLYSYYLEGFDPEWNEPSTARSATYTNLDPGDYTLRIKRVVPGIDEHGEELQLSISILPPYWRTTWFRSLVFLVIMVIIFTLIHFFVYREKIKNDLVIEKIKARKLHELDMLKLKFFTNISHEIRTPLTLILAPLEKLKNRQLNPAEMGAHIDIMYRNTKQLDRLINQLLDFRKLETGNLKLELMQGDLVRFVNEVVHSFEAYAAEKAIRLQFNTLRKSMVVRFDPDKMEKILNNLLSNAIKFTENEGKVVVNLSLVFDSNDDDLDNSQTDRQFIEITVRDTGQGIAQSNLSKIFNRFFQGSDKVEQTGTGIGLAFVKDLVKLHNGKIFVSSQPGKGSKFTVRIPYLLSEKEEENQQKAEDALPDKIEVQKEPEVVDDDSIPANILLVVEDNPDVRLLIVSHFSSAFQVMEAANGREGWEQALENVPDVIISDILMPELDGFELCKKVKRDERTSHIPVLLLTALHSKEHIIKGLSIGADDYITKPFDLTILQTKIENMLAVRNSLKEKYSGEITLQPQNITISSPDEKFLHKAMEVVELHIADPELDIEGFAREVGVSRMQLYRKLNALTDMTVKEFIRNIRLKRASQLLVQDKMTVSEIAYNVGFKDLSHFRKCFRQMYGMNATEYIRRNKSEENEIAR